MADHVEAREHAQAAFIPGAQLARAFYEQAVRPVLDETLPGVPHAAGLLGTGSELLGFDSPRSTDHGWGPRVDLFLRPADAADHAEALREQLTRRLPRRFHGYPVNFTTPPGAPERIGVMADTDGPLRHRVQVYDAQARLTGKLGFDPLAPGAPGLHDWLSTPSQLLAETVDGPLFHDGLGTLTAACARLAWYPDQLWRHLLARQWERVSEQEAFVGRCAEAGDELGSAVVAAAIARDLMRLCLLLERRYAPYGKWLGSAFARLGCAAAIGPALRAALAAPDHAAREHALCQAYEKVAALQNTSGLAEPVDPARRRYHDRPYLVLHAERLAAALDATVTDPAVRALPHYGAVDQWTDSTALLGDARARRAPYEP